MTKRISISVVCTVLVIIAATGAVPVYAQEASPSPTLRAAAATPSTQLDDLKARLATKVAELQTVVKRAMHGVVKTVSLTSATVETKTKDIKIELTDDVTVAQIVGGKRVSLDVTDIDVDDPITVFGSYDETLDLLKAQHIFIESSTEVLRVSGTVADVDSDAFQLTVNTPEGRTIIIDIEKTTKTVLWTMDGGLEKGGFSKIIVGDTVHISGKPDAKEENRISALRILDLGNITGAATSPTVGTSPTATGAATPRPTLRTTVAPTDTP